MTYQSRRNPRAKQTEALEKIDGRRAFAVLMGMRTGKTKVVVDDWGRMVDRGDCDDLLVVAPAGAYLPWAKALTDDLPAEIVARAAVLVWRSDRARTKSFLADLRRFLEHTGPRVLIMNAEAVSSVAAARKLLVDFLTQKPRRSTFAVDESVIIKNPDSEVGEFCVNVAALARYRRIMTGLVSPRSPLDLWNQFRFLDPTILGFNRFTTFRARYARVRQVCMLPRDVIYARLRKAAGVGAYKTEAELQRIAMSLDPELNPNGMSSQQLRQYINTVVDSMPRDDAVEALLRLGVYIQTVPIIDGFQNLEELQSLIAPHSFRARLEDCYDMPKSDYSFRDVEWHPQQKKHYEEVREEATTQLESLDYVTATHVITRMLRLHQILCGHAVDEGGTLHPVPEMRTKALLDLLRDYEGKAVVWCSYDYNVRGVAAALTKEFGEGSVARFWGGNSKTREAEEVRFKTDPECRFEVATPDAGKYGRDWSVADLVVYYSMKNDLDHRQQSEDRVKADGKMRPIAYVDLRVQNTVEDRIVRCLRDKLDMSTMINGDNWREWLV